MKQALKNLNTFYSAQLRYQKTPPDNWWGFL
jgi:hypothetical protein